MNLLIKITIFYFEIKKNLGAIIKIFRKNDDANKAIINIIVLI